MLDVIGIARVNAVSPDLDLRQSVLPAGIWTFAWFYIRPQSPRKSKGVNILVHGLSIWFKHYYRLCSLEVAFDHAISRNLSLPELWSEATAQKEDYAYQSTFFYDNGEPNFDLPELKASTIDTLSFGRCLLFNISRRFPPKGWILPSFLNKLDGAAPLFQVTALSSEALPRAISGGQYNRYI